MPSAEVQEFDLELLSEAALADDPYPDRPLRLTVLGYRDDEAGGFDAAVEIRTTPEQFLRLVDSWRALQLGLADRGRKQARARLELESRVDEARRTALEEERAGRPDLDDPLALMDVLEQVRRGLEHRLGPVPDDPPPNDSSPGDRP